MAKVLYANSISAHLAENGPVEALQLEMHAMEQLGLGVYVCSGFIVILDRVAPDDVVSGLFAQIESTLVEP